MLQRLRKLTYFDSPTKLDWGIYFIAFIILQIPAIINFYYNDGANNAYTQFAHSLLNGNLTLPVMSDYGDMAHYNGNYYLPYPPLPSLILLPFVALLGVANVNTVAIAAVMACGSLYLLFCIFQRLGIEQKYFIWLFAGFFFGTGYWLALFNSHHSYSFAHITSCLFQFLIINEALGKKRWALIGVFIGCSFLTRQFTIFYFLFAVGYLVYYDLKTDRKTFFRNLIALSLTTGAFVGLYLCYNYVRFGNMLSTGYEYILYLGILKERVAEYGVFSPHYFLFNLYSFFLKGFNIEFQGNLHLNIKDMDLWGTSLLAASPFLIASIKATLPRIPKIFAWCTIIIILFGQLFYHNNGWHQINTSRFSLDFLPLLMILTALGIKSIPDWLIKGLVGYSILLNIIGFLIHSIYQ
jgi:hypothetical protein